MAEGFDPLGDIGNFFKKEGLKTWQHAKSTAVITLEQFIRARARILVDREITRLIPVETMERALKALEAPEKEELGEKLRPLELPRERRPVQPPVVVPGVPPQQPNRPPILPEDPLKLYIERALLPHELPNLNTEAKDDVPGQS
jgi:hypothetical protein